MDAIAEPPVKKTTMPMLGLDGVRGNMKKLVIAFDVDGTLINENGIPMKPIIEMLKTLSKLTKNVRIIVWSGGGQEYAERWVRKLELEHYVWKAMQKDMSLGVDIAIDDMHACALGDKNVIVRLK